MRIVLTLYLLMLSVFVHGQTVYRTPAGKKYHTATCRYVKNVSHRMDIKDAAKLGLSPCAQCNPGGQRLGAVSSASSGLGIKPGEASGSLSRSVQCQGTTKKGSRCKHLTKNVNGYCHQHEPR